MAFDVYFQAFSSGDASSADGPTLAKVLGRWVKETTDGWARVETADGGADLYGYDDLSSGFMANRISGDEIWDVLVAAAAAGRLAILPVGCPACVTDAETAKQLPAELASDVVEVATGRDLRNVILSG